MSLNTKRRHLMYECDTVVLLQRHFLVLYNCTIERHIWTKQHSRFAALQIQWIIYTVQDLHVMRHIDDSSLVKSCDISALGILNFLHRHEGCLYINVRIATTWIIAGHVKLANSLTYSNESKTSTWLYKLDIYVAVECQWKKLEMVNLINRRCSKECLQ